MMQLNGRTTCFVMLNSSYGSELRSVFFIDHVMIGSTKLSILQAPLFSFVSQV